MKKKLRKKNGLLNSKALVLALLGGGSSLHAVNSKAVSVISDHSVCIEQQVGTTFKLKGKVVDKSNVPIIGANILIEGTTNGVITDFDGNFTLDVHENDVLKVSYIGYISQEVKLSQNITDLQICLIEDTETLEEVVVVGYSSQKKESLTGSLQTLKSNKLKDITTPSVTNMLSGKAPGVYVASGSGRPGSEGAIIIRGKSTVNGSTDPLWVVDGVIVGSNAGALNPTDIETMTILKDAASTAIYGSQGANGVVLVTTKSAKADKLSVNISAKTGITNLYTGNFEIMNGAQLYDLYNSFSNKEMISFPRWNPELRNSDFSWWDLATQTGFVQDYNLSINGGTDKLRSFFSIGLYDETGAVKGYDYTRYNVRYKGHFSPAKWLVIRPSFSGSLKKTDDRQYSVGAMYNNLPWDSPYDENGNIVPHYSETWVNSNSTNYLYDLQYNYSNGDNYEFMINFDFDIKLTNWLTFSSVNNYRWNGNFSKSYVDPKSSGGKSVQGRITENRSYQQRRYTNHILRFNKLFDKHSVNALIAYEFNDYSNRPMSASGTGIISGISVFDAASLPESIGGNITEWAVQSLLSNVNYSYDNKYLAQLSFRRDGASNFGDNAKYGNFFSISGGWNIHKEKWFKFESVNQLKLRASYGSVGNRPNSLYPQYDLYTASSSYNGIPGSLISQVGNKNLTWEKTYTAGVGLDMRFFERLSLSLDYYHKRTTNLLYDVPVSGLTGVTRIWRNVGESQNKGFEATVNVDLIRNKELTWNFDFNIGLNRNKVISLYGGDVEIIKGDGTGVAGSAQKLLKPGYDTDTWYMREWAGVDPDDGSPLWYKHVENSDGSITKETTKNYSEATETACGTYNPDFFGGFSSTVNYKNFDFGFVCTFSKGGKIYHMGRTHYDSDGTFTDRNQMVLQDGWKRWEKPGDIATHPVASYNNQSNSNSVSSRYLEDASYLKMKSLTVGYNFNLPQLNISNARIFLSGENLFCLTSFSGVDPEIPPHNGSILGVYDRSMYPSTRKFMLGLSVSF